MLLSCDSHVIIICDQVGSTSAQGANSSLVEFALRRLSAGDCHMTISALSHDPV